MITLSKVAQHVVMLSTVLLASGIGCASATSTSASAASPERTELGIIDTRPGSGARAATRQCLYVHYVGTLPDGREFESSRTPLPNGLAPAPIAFELGTGAVMQGWEQGLRAMHVGGMRRLFVPYRLAYGSGGRPPAIPPRTDLAFDLELLALATFLAATSGRFTRG